MRSNRVFISVKTIVSFILKVVFMKNLFKFAAMMAAVVSASSFVSCDDDDEKFESKTFTVELPAPAPPIKYDDATHSIGWEWINQSEAAVDAISFDYVCDSTNLWGSSRKEVWTFSTKENGDEVLKFRLYRLDKSILPSLKDSVPLLTFPVDIDMNDYFKDRLSGKHFSNDPASRVVKDTMITFKK